jgi:hypothetical protein
LDLEVITCKTNNAKEETKLGLDEGLSDFGITYAIFIIEFK